jgi:hypothetical protein
LTWHDEAEHFEKRIKKQRVYRYHRYESLLQRVRDMSESEHEVYGYELIRIGEREFVRQYIEYNQHFYLKPEHMSKRITVKGSKHETR